MATFKDNLEAALRGELNEDWRKLGIEFKIVRELSSTLKIIELTYPRPGSIIPKLQTKRYILSYTITEERANIALLQYREGDENINERLVLIIRQNLKL